MERYLLDKNWEYVESNLQNPLLVGMLRGWKTTDLPHDYAIEKGRNPASTAGTDEGFFQGAGLYYRKSFVLKPEGADKRVWLEFEGVFGVTQVWVNGQLAAKHLNPYTGFWPEITALVHPGENEITLHVDSRMKPSSRWYVGTGLCRRVWLPPHRGKRRRPASHPALRDQGHRGGGGGAGGVRPPVRPGGWGALRAGGRGRADRRRRGRRGDGPAPGGARSAVEPGAAIPVHPAGHRLRRGKNRRVRGAGGHPHHRAGQ